jgi:hypothetical protein
MAQVTGTVILRRNGEVLRSKEGAELTLGGKERTLIKGHSVYGYSEKVAEGMIKCTIAHVGGDDIIGWSNTVDGTLEFETDTGDTYLLANAVCTNVVTLKGGEGDVELEFGGDPAVKI